MWMSKATGLDGTSLPHRRERTHDADGAPVHGAREAVRSLGDRFETVFNEHAALIYRTAYGVTGRHEDAEDVLQSVFLRLLRRDVSLEATTNPKGYLYRAAVNLSLDIVRSRAREVSMDVTTLPEPATSNDAPDDELHRLLYRAIADLKPEAAQIQRLRRS
jgi:RNA polymerase sigma-70 factor (ECF subfamily)